MAQLVPTTPILDITNLKGKNLDSPEFRQFMIRLTQYLNLMARATNAKDDGEYSTAQTDNGQQFWSLIAGEQPRAVNRIVIDFGALPNGTVSTTKAVNHNINFPPGSIWTRTFGQATNTTTGAGVQLSYSSPTLANNIEFNTTATQVIITVDATVDWSAYDTTYIYLEWI